jgi:hypothetical protein
MSYVPLNNFSLILRRHHCRWRAVKFRPTCMLGAQGLWAWRVIYRAMPAMTRGYSFFQFHPKDQQIQSPLMTRKAMWRTYSNPDPNGSPFSPHMWHARGCWEPIQTRIHTRAHTCIYAIGQSMIWSTATNWNEKKFCDMGMGASPENFLKNCAFYSLFWGRKFKFMNTSWA